MLKKTLGYIISIAGIAILAISTIKPLKATLTFIPKQINDLTLMISGLVVVVIGIMLIYNSPSGHKRVHEVPIYHGKDVVGFRRIGKK
mgnify:CR=1 FL=1